MSDATLLGIAGIIGSLAGVWLGHHWQESNEVRRDLRHALEQLIALSLESVAQLEHLEAERVGGPAAPPIRPELAVSLYGAQARVALSRADLSDDVLAMTEAIQEATLAQFEPDPGIRRQARQKALHAVQHFTQAAASDLYRRGWQRLWGRLHHRAAAPIDLR